MGDKHEPTLFPFYNILFCIQLNREKLHRAIRSGNIDLVQQLIELPEGLNLARAKNYFGLYRLICKMN